MRRINLFLRKLNISQIIILAFICVIIVGTLLLWLPFASRTGNSNGLLTALFTATSATCVTGLALGDTYTQWSLIGQLVILTMIEVGGLGFMSIASLFFFTLRKNFDLKPMLIMAQSVGTENMGDVLRIQKKIVMGSISVEAIGAVILSIRFAKWYSIPKAIWMGVFHSISAFCNAGFDILGFEVPGGSLIYFNSDAVILLTLSALIIIGGIGFVIWDDLTRERRPSRWSIYTKIVLITSVVLLIGGTIVYYILESRNIYTMADMTVQGKILNAFFQSTTTRTAGFAAVDQGSLTETGKIFSLFLMFIGGASGSTAGGLKIVTFVIIVLFMLSRMRGLKVVTVFGRRVSNTQIMNALCLFGMMTAFSYIGAIVMCGTTEFKFIDSMYVMVSALATVGLSTGDLGGISLVTKLLIILYMFFGRVGILTISMGFLQKTNNSANIKYPEVNLPIG